MSNLANERTSDLYPHTCARAAPRKLYAALLGLANTCIEAPTCRAGRVLCVPMKPGARFTRRSTKWYWRLHRGACRGCVSRPPPGMQQNWGSRLLNTNQMHARELPDTATEHIRGRVQGKPGGGGRQRLGESGAGTLERGRTSRA